MWVVDEARTHAVRVPRHQVGSDEARTQAVRVPRQKVGSERAE